MNFFTTFPLLMLTLLFMPVDSSANNDTKTDVKMDNQRLQDIISRLDENYQGQSGYWQFNIANLAVTVITDESHDRMRIIIPITKTEELEQKQLYRLLQANFDTSLDARYAIAKDILWSTFIHPLSSLDDDEFLSGLGQTVNLVSTYGSSYSSGLLNFGGGDSGDILRRQLIDELIEKGQAI